ncbi:MAG: flippase-like domain-containing protein [Alphaproteobacteria bacterium]
MTGRGGMMLAVTVGVALAAAVLLSADLGAALDATASAGWAVLAVSLYRTVPLLFDTLGWRALLSAPRPGLAALLRARWIGESVNTLLPVAQVGGDVARARLLALLGTPTAAAGASVLVDFTLGLVAQLLFTALGIALLLALVPWQGEAAPGLVGLAAAVAAVVLLVLAQRRGWLGRIAAKLARFAGRGLARFAAGAAALDREAAQLHGRPAALAACIGWRLIGWFARGFETWLILYALGMPVGPAEALVIESLSYFARSIAFAIPGALGAQEGAILLVAGLLGIPPEAALALALAKRLREVAVSAPGLLAWALTERRGLAALGGLGRGPAKP